MAGIELKGLQGLLELGVVEASGQPQREKIEHVPILEVFPGICQPRRSFNESALRELADSIKAQGILQPLILRIREQGGYEIVAGERRWRAAKIVNCETVPAIIRLIDDQMALAYGLIENIQREDLNPIEEAVAFVRLIDEFKLSHSDVALMVGRSREHVSNIIRLLSLPVPIKELLISGSIRVGHARALLTLDPLAQTILVTQIVEKDLSVREVEKLAALSKLNGDGAGKEVRAVDLNSAVYLSWSDDLSERLDTKVSVKLNKNYMGKIVIKIDSKAKMDWLVEHLMLDV